MYPSEALYEQYLAHMVVMDNSIRRGINAVKVKFHLGTVKLFLIIFLSFHLILVQDFACISHKGFIFLFPSFATSQRILFHVILNCLFGQMVSSQSNTLESCI